MSRLLKSNFNLLKSNLHIYCPTLQIPYSFVLGGEEVTTRHWKRYISRLQTNERPGYTWLGKTETSITIPESNNRVRYRYLFCQYVLGVKLCGRITRHAQQNERSYLWLYDVWMEVNTCKSSKQKLNTKLATESEVIGSSD